jgi:hypothetical protein
VNNILRKSPIERLCSSVSITPHDGLKWLMIAGVSFRDGVITDELSRTDIAIARRELSMLVEMGKQVMPRHCFGGA